MPDYGFSAGILGPLDVELLQRICGRIMAQPWFTPDVSRRREFAAFVLRLHRRGMIIPEKLEAIAMTAARAHYVSDAALQAPQGLWERRVLVVEDEPLLARDIQKRLANVGATVIGPAGTVKDALQMAQEGNLAAALLDISLDGEMVFPVAELLRARQIPFAFISGQEQPQLPPDFRSVPVFPKPADWAKVAAYLTA